VAFKNMEPKRNLINKGIDDLNAELK